MICLILLWFSYGLSRMFQLPQFVWALRSSVWDVFFNFLLIDATDRSKISSDQKRFFIASSLYPLSFFANTPFKVNGTCIKKFIKVCIKNFNFKLFYIYIASYRDCLRKIMGVCANIELNSISIATNFTFICCVYIRRYLLKNVFYPRAF